MIFIIDGKDVEFKTLEDFCLWIHEKDSPIIVQENLIDQTKYEVYDFKDICNEVVNKVLVKI